MSPARVGPIGSASSVFGGSRGSGTPGAIPGVSVIGGGGIGGALVGAGVPGVIGTIGGGARAALGAVGGAGGGTTGGQSGDGDQQNAQAILHNFLDSLGLGSLYNEAVQWIAGGFNADYVLYQLRQTDEYKQRFPYMAVRRQAGLPAISEGDAIALERSYRQVALSAGMPSGLFDTPDDFTKLIGSDVSPAEFQSRVNDGFLRVTQAPPEIRTAFGRIFGPQGDTALAAVFIDPDRTLPALENMVRQAEASGTAARFGMPITDVTAAKLADYGVDRTVAEQGFTKLAGIAPLFDETAAENTDLSVSGEGVGAAFFADQQANLAIARRQSQRQGAFEGGGGAATTATGAVGLGTATQGGGV